MITPSLKNSYGHVGDLHADDQRAALLDLVQRVGAGRADGGQGEQAGCAGAGEQCSSTHEGTPGLVLVGGGEATGVPVGEGELLASVSRRQMLAPAGLGADPAEKLDHRVGAQIGGDAGADIEQRIDLDEVEADDLQPLGDGAQRIAQLGVAHAVRLGRNAAGHQRHVQRVDVDAHIAGSALRQQRGDAGWAQTAELRHGDDAVAVAEHVLDLFAAVAQAADADLRQALDVGHRGDVAEGVAVGVAQPVHERCVVGVCVEVQHVQRAGEGAHHRVGDRVVAAQHDGQRAACQDGGDGGGDQLEA